MNVPLIASVVSAVILVSGLFITWLLTRPDKTPKPEPAHLGQIRALEQAFPVGRAFQYLGYAMFPFKHAETLWTADDEPAVILAELHCEYRREDGAICTHHLTYAQAMAIADNNPSRTQNATMELQRDGVKD